MPAFRRVYEREGKVLFLGVQRKIAFSTVRTWQGERRNLLSIADLQLQNLLLESLI